MKTANDIRTYRDLIVWRKSVALVTSVYRATKDFPSHELYGLTSQMRRCAVSVPSNIAEGYGRRATGDYLRFLQIGIGSVYELQTQLEISKNFGYLAESDSTRLLEDLAEIERMLASLTSKLRSPQRRPAATPPAVP